MLRKELPLGLVIAFIEEEAIGKYYNPKVFFILNKLIKYHCSTNDIYFLYIQLEFTDHNIEYLRVSLIIKTKYLIALI